MMNLKRVSQISRALTADGASGFVRVATPNPFVVGMTVNLTSAGPAVLGLQISDIKGVGGSTDVAVYLIDPATQAAYDASAYTTLLTSLIIAPAQTLWYEVGVDGVVPTPFTDLQMRSIMDAILPASLSGGVTDAQLQVTLNKYVYPVLGANLYLAISTVDASVSVGAGSYLMMSTVDVSFADGVEPTLGQSKLLAAKIYVPCRWASTTTVHFKTSAGTGTVFLWPCT